MNDKISKNFNTIRVIFEATPDELKLTSQLKNRISSDSNLILILSPTIKELNSCFNEIAHDLFRKKDIKNIKTDFPKKEIILDNETIIFKSIDLIDSLDGYRFKKIIFTNK